MQTLDRALGDLADVVADDLEHPSHLLAQLRDGGRGAAAIARVLSLPEDHPACLRRPLSGRRHVAWTSTLRFAPVRARARALGVTVNDLFVCALAGAFRGYLQGQHESLREGRNLRVSIPVNLRRQDDDALGNFFGLVLLDLPVGIADWRERLAIVAQRMDGLKHSAEPRAVLFALAAAGHMPVPLEKRLVNVVGAKAVAVVSNLPGPRRPLSIGGARLSSLVFWPPQAGGIGIGVSLMSYAGRISVGVSADCALIPEPEAIVAAFEHELQRMLDGSPGRAVKTDPRQRAARSLRQD